MKIKITILLIVILPVLANGAKVEVPFDSKQWRFESGEYRIGEYLGAKSLYLKKNRAFLSGVEFKNGVIEYDVSFPEGRAFIGVMFRAVDSLNYEEFYIRTHQSGNPDANQYTPVYNGLAGWQIYYGKGFGTPVIYKYNQWNHVKLVIIESQMEVYVNDMTEPLMLCQLKRNPVAGEIGFGNFLSESHFANFSYEISDDVKLKSMQTDPVKTEGGVIQHWGISEPFPETSLNSAVLDNSFVNKLKWSTASAEWDTRTVNIASVVRWTRENNTVFARIHIQSESDQIKKLSIGFSDRCKIYFNGQLLFPGEDGYNSRDYRFLGTMGLFDAVFLPLKKGNNDLFIAVSESFGGWGVRAKLEDLEKITIAVPKL